MFIKMTNREKEVCKYLIKGNGNKEIGHMLNISANTVKEYIKKILLNSDLRNRTHLAYMLGKSNFR